MVPDFATGTYTGLVCSTETGPITDIVPKEPYKEWEWFRFSSLIKPHFIPDGHGAYEVVVEV